MAGEYFNPMDKEFNTNVEQIGASSNPFQHQTEALKARIFHGANSVEFSFFGQGKTNKDQPGPESFGKQERQDMRDLAEWNKVKTSTHATVSINGLSGYNAQQGGFNTEAQDRSFIELQKAIDFASEASTGGAVVFHTGESQRNMFDNFRDDKGNSLFKTHSKEDDEGVFHLINEKDKKIQAISMDTRLTRPKLDDKNPYMVDSNGKEIIDPYSGQKIKRYKHKDDNPEAEPEMEEYTLREFIQKREGESSKRFSNLDKDQKLKWVKDFYKDEIENNINYQLGQARYYAENHKDDENDLERIGNSLNYYKNLKDNLSEDEWKDNFKNIADDLGRSGLVPPKNKDPIEYLERLYNNKIQSLSYINDMKITAEKQAFSQRKNFDELVFAEDFAQKQATDKMAEAAIYAFQKTQERIRAGDDMIKKNPLYISPESWRPEDYGGHPEEMARLVREARAKVADKLSDQYGTEKAKQIAKQSIKATLDVGHMNTWRRHFVKKDGESEEKFDKRFKTWVLDESQKLAKEGIVGHVHLSDNYGYDDEHLAIGQGNAPVKEFVKIMRENGVTDFIAEAGSFNAMSALPDAWSELGSSIYRVGAGDAGSSLDAWGNVHQGYFGQTEGPRYIIGDYSPSEDFKGSPFFSGTPLE